jgi:RNA polymerase sigma-70 factor (ECF subfamily)
LYRPKEFAYQFHRQLTSYAMNNTLPAFRCSPSDSIGTRASLIHRIKNWSDDESWQEFFNTYWQTIYGVAINAGLTESEAEEVVQATIVSVAKRIREFDYKPEVGSFKHWLLNQANWRIADQLRDRQRDLRRHQRPSQTATSTRTRTIEKVVDAMHDPDRLWQREWNKSFAKTTLQRVKAQVKPKHYQVFRSLRGERLAIEKSQRNVAGQHRPSLSHQFPYFATAQKTAQARRGRTRTQSSCAAVTTQKNTDRQHENTRIKSGRISGQHSWIEIVTSGRAPGLFQLQLTGLYATSTAAAAIRAEEKWRSRRVPSRNALESFRDGNRLVRDRALLTERTTALLCA